MENDVHDQFKVIETDIKVIKAQLRSLYRMLPYDIESVQTNRNIHVLLMNLGISAANLKQNICRLKVTCRGERS